MPTLLTEEHRRSLPPRNSRDMQENPASPVQARKNRWRHLLYTSPVLWYISPKRKRHEQRNHQLRHTECLLPPVLLLLVWLLLACRSPGARRPPLTTANQKGSKQP